MRERAYKARVRPQQEDKQKQRGGRQKEEGEGEKSKGGKPKPVKKSGGMTTLPAARQGRDSGCGVQTEAAPSARGRTQPGTMSTNLNPKPQTHVHKLRAEVPAGHMCTLAELCCLARRPCRPWLCQLAGGGEGGWRGHRHVLHASVGADGPRREQLHRGEPGAQGIRTTSTRMC